MEQTTQTQTRWKKGTTEEWKKFNTEVQALWQQTGKKKKKKTYKHYSTQ